MTIDNKLAQHLLNGSDEKQQNRISTGTKHHTSGVNFGTRELVN